MTKDEAMRMALEWIEAQHEPRMIGAYQAIKALRTALAQPELPQRKSLTDEEKEILDAVRRELYQQNHNGDAPGHSHQVPGVWDSDNGKKAGKPCAWCLTWKKFTALIEREKSHEIKD